MTTTTPPLVDINGLHNGLYFEYKWLPFEYLACVLYVYKLNRRHYYSMSCVCVCLCYDTHAVQMMSLLVSMFIWVWSGQ